jgi:hypothetical protein
VLSTIEEAEAFAESRGVVLAGKTENKEQMVALRSFDYTANGSVHLGILQFASPASAAQWKRMLDDLPFGQEYRIQKGPIAFTFFGDRDADVQKVLAALK